MKNTKIKIMTKLEKASCGIPYKSLGKMERKAVEILKEEKEICFIEFSNEFYIIKFNAGV